MPIDEMTDPTKTIMTPYRRLVSWKQAMAYDNQTSWSPDKYQREGGEAFRMTFERVLPWEETSMNDNSQETTNTTDTAQPIDYSLLVARAIRIAAVCHGEQMNQDGTAYILHPLRVMMAATSPLDMIVAVLHDAIEDTELTLQELIDSHWPQEVVEALDCLTKREGEEYDSFIQRLSWNPIAVRVKLLDLYDNIDVTRLPELGDYELQRTAKYHRAIKFLKGIPYQ